MNDLQEHDAGELVSFDHLMGVDEAGRGCLAGPVVAGACVVSQEFFESAEILARTAAINDSKQMSAEAREALFQLMEQLKEEGHLDFAVAEGSVALIAERNILGQRVSLCSWRWRRCRIARRSGPCRWRQQLDRYLNSAVRKGCACWWMDDR